MYLHEVLTLNHEPMLHNYPIFDPAYRDELNDKILENYMNREIGQETISMFVFSLNRKMRQIMPLYNQLYLSTRLEFDPLNTIDIRSFTESTGTAKASDTVTTVANENSESDSASKSVGEAVDYDFPQERLKGNKDYASRASDNNNESTATSTAKGDSTSTQNGASDTSQDGTSDSTTKGFQGNRSALLMDYRQTFMNIDMDVIRELEPCFMQVLSTSDSFVNERYYI